MGNVTLQQDQPTDLQEVLVRLEEIENALDAIMKDRQYQYGLIQEVENRLEEVANAYDSQKELDRAGDERKLIEKIEKRIGEVAKAYDGVRKELNRLTDQRNALEEIEKRLGEVAAACDGVRKDVASLADRIGENEKRGQDTIRQVMELEDALWSSRETLENVKSSYQESFSFRIGSLVVHAVRRPWKLVALPVRMAVLVWYAVSSRDALGRKREPEPRSGDLHEPPTTA